MDANADLACFDKIFSALASCWVRRLYRKTAGWVTRHMLPIVKEDDISRHWGLLENSVSGGWLQQMERIPIRASQKVPIVPGLNLGFRVFRYAKERVVLVNSTLEHHHLEPSAWHAYKPSCRRDATQCVCKTHTSLLTQMHLDCSSKQHGGPRWGLIYRGILVAFVKLEPMDYASCGDYLIRQNNKMYPASCMAPWGTTWGATWWFGTPLHM